MIDAYVLACFGFAGVVVFEHVGLWSGIRLGPVFGWVVDCLSACANYLTEIFCWLPSYVLLGAPMESPLARHLTCFSSCHVVAYTVVQHIRHRRWKDKSNEWASLSRVQGGHT